MFSNIFIIAIRVYTSTEAGGKEITRWFVKKMLENKSAACGRVTRMLVCDLMKRCVTTPGVRLFHQPGRGMWCGQLSSTLTAGCQGNWLSVLVYARPPRQPHPSWDPTIQTEATESFQQPVNGGLQLLSGADRMLSSNLWTKGKLLWSGTKNFISRRVTCN